MPRSRRNRPWQPRRRRPVPQNPTVYHLDTFSLEDVRRWKQGQDEFKRVYWEWYSQLAFQRSKVLSEIKAALVEAAVGPFDFNDYQRAVKYKWSFDPLSVRGSLLDEVGGRFNIGEIDRTKFTPFPALYLGEDKMTALQEMFQVDPLGRDGLTAEELALTTPDSEANVAVFGSLETIIDLSQPSRLKKAVDLIKDFHVTDDLVKDGRKLGININVVVDVPTLMSTLTYENWRAFPQHVDVPANCQIFGQLVSEAGIEGIKYPSKYAGKNCLAVFPQNFRGKDSFVELKDQTPPGVDRRRLDSSTVDSL